MLKVQRIEQVNPPLAEGVAYSVQPATSPVAAEWSTAANGTEYALSCLDFTGGLDNRIAVWALTNTASLRPPRRGATGEQVHRQRGLATRQGRSSARALTPQADGLKVKTQPARHATTTR